MMNNYLEQLERIRDLKYRIYEFLYPPDERVITVEKVADWCLELCEILEELVKDE
ncbi:hypothetical protein JOD02_001844 [Caldicoprobacter guelmensis]|uniref:hypothetical protein n=1 Tax=Caldicoprobacter guelmensis TaxID=1170224 RepID=UPI00195AB24D|nr:hypothetical protein [Caldicoprobacter guelmensis]MBM7582975.1 hypothetical protein [Caldicoprobacter guelmensis]